MKRITAEVNLNDILVALKEERNCKIEICEDGWSGITYEHSAGYDDSIAIIDLESHDYFEFEKEEDYISWLKDSFEEEIEFDEKYLIKIKFVR